MMKKMLARSLLLFVATGALFSSAEDTNINWRIQGYDDMTASVGDTFTFNWNFRHNVYIHPNGRCSDSDAIEIGTSSGASYTFTEDDVGEVTFVCRIPGHCFAGQILKVKISNPPSPAPVSPAPVSPESTDIPQTALANGNFETLFYALSEADLVEALSEPAGPFTVFAPTNEAFESLPDGLVTCLLEPSNKDTLTDILKYHVLAGKVLSTDLSDGLTATTLNGDNLVVDLSAGVKINDSIVSTVDVEASNGVIHVIDSVLVPSDIDVASFLTSCQQEEEEEEEPICKDVDDWSDIFGFDCRFYAQFFCLFAGIFQDANGVDASEACCACGGGVEIVPIKDIPQTAIANGNFETLVTALGATDLVTPLSEPAGPFTVFAPTDEAFANLPDGLVTCLLEPDNKDTLADILKYHVLAGKVLSTDLSDGLTATTLNGDDVVVDLSDGVKINNSIVSTVDVEASNGIIHVIDSVLVPSDIDVGAFLTSCQQQEEEQEGECKKVSTQENFVLSDFISKTWYAHMQVPSRFNPAEQNYCVTAQYEARSRPSIPWGYTIDVTNKGRLGSTDGESTGAQLCAWEKNSSDPSKLGVAPCGIPRKVSGDFWAIRYNEDEGYAIISGGQPTVPSGNTGLCKTGKGLDQTGLWFFSRSPIRNETLMSYLDDIAKNEEGFDTSVLLPVDHTGCVYDDEDSDGRRHRTLLLDDKSNEAMLRGSGTA